MGVLYASFAQDPSRKTDFGLAWFSARAMFSGRDPYLLVGPGLEYVNPYHLYYPATAFVAAMPLAAFSEQVASLAFVALAAFLLVYGMTADGWHRLPLIASAAYMDSVMAAQWTIILTAAIFLPWLGILAVAKPQTGLPVLAGTPSRTAIMAGAVGALTLLVVSFLLLPSWPSEWFARIKGGNPLHAPLLNPLGCLTAFVLLRWRRPEAWLVFVTAILPQTFMWYSALSLLTVAATYREACALAFISTTGFMLGTLAVYKGISHLGMMAWTIYISTTFLPAVIVILRRPNEGVGPFWLHWAAMHRTAGRHVDSGRVRGAD
jgi:hypothetical protein